MPVWRPFININAIRKKVCFFYRNIYPNKNAYFLSDCIDSWNGWAPWAFPLCTCQYSSRKSNPYFIWVRAHWCLFWLPFHLLSSAELFSWMGGLMTVYALPLQSLRPACMFYMHVSLRLWEPSKSHNSYIKLVYQINILYLNMDGIDYFFSINGKKRYYSCS